MRKIVYSYSPGLQICGVGIIIILLLAVLTVACVSVPGSTLQYTTSPIPSITLTSTQTPTIIWFPPTATHTPFPTATPLPPTPDQRPGLGDVIFQDDFATAEAWVLSSTPKGNMALGDHELTIYIAQSRVYLYSLRDGPILDDFYAEITASPTLCRAADEYGLLIRVSPLLDYYRFSVSCDGQARLDRVYGGQVSSPQPWTPGGMIQVGAPSLSRLGVWAVGKEMRFFVNDAYQFTVRDPLLQSGTLGVFARSAGDTAVTVSFSNLVVRSIGP